MHNLGATSTVWIIKFQCVIVACQTSLTCLKKRKWCKALNLTNSKTTVVAFSFLQFTAVSEARCWAQLPPHPWCPLSGQTTDAESANSKHILICRHLENTVAQPGKAEYGKRKDRIKQKVDTGWLQRHAKQAKGLELPSVDSKGDEAEGRKEIKSLLLIIWTLLFGQRTSEELDMKITLKQRLCFHLSQNQGTIRTKPERHRI